MRTALLLLFLCSSALAEHIELKLENALKSDSPKTREWVLSPRIQFDLVDGKAIAPVIELKRGWVVPSWKGVVDRISVEKEGDKLSGSLTARVQSVVLSSGEYTFKFEARIDDEKKISGTFESGSEKGELSGRVLPARPAFDPEDCVATLHIVKGLPDSKTLTVFVNRQTGELVSGFATSPNYSRRPFDVDLSSLKWVDSKLAGTISISRLNKREPDDGERAVFAEYKIDATIDSHQVRGKFTGKNLEQAEVQGEVWGELRARHDLGKETKMWVKLEDGYSGGAMWQNRVFFRFRLREGNFIEGNSGNNKGVFQATMTGAKLTIGKTTIVGNLESNVQKSGSVKEGKYRFKLKGIRSGRVLYGRFYTSFEGKENHSGYFVGGIE